MSDHIYLDHNATTPVDERVLDAMLPYFREHYGNAASRHHAMGCDAARAVESARVQVADALGADPREIVWTSGATESNNLVFEGLVRSPAYRARRHIVTVRTEHKAVLDPVRRLEQKGVEVTVLGVDAEGRVDCEELESALRDDTLVCSVMLANNETGVLHDLAAIGAACRERGILVHSDATQAVGKEAIDLATLPVDLLSFSAHKVYGPKGAGGLFVRRKGPRVRLAALIEGGGHERGMRSGTLNVPGIVGLGAAVALADALRAEESPRLRGQRDRLEAGLTAVGGIVNGVGAPRLANTANVSFPGRDAERLIRQCPGLCVSTASACTSASLQPSYVLGAMGLEGKRVRGSIRFSLGRPTTDADIELVIDRVRAAL